MYYKPQREVKVWIRQTLLIRDGDKCFYCGNFMDVGERTLEHLQPKSRHGLLNIHNIVLTHAHCNRQYGNLSREEKLLLREYRLGKILLKRVPKMGWKSVLAHWITRRLFRYCWERSRSSEKEGHHAGNGVAGE